MLSVSEHTYLNESERIFHNLKGTWNFSRIIKDESLRITHKAKGEVIFTSRVSTGKRGLRTPTGTFVITDKHKKHNSSIYGSSMPYFQRLSCSAFGFHVGNCPGYAASHGCIRMPYSSAKKLFGITPVGTRVIIQK